MERVQVEIYGQVYSIKGAHDPAHIRELAAYVDAKMKEVEKGTGTVDPHRVAILTAMTIAEEFYRMRERYGDLNLAADNAVKRLLHLTHTVPEKDDEVRSPG
jgi:cell division protein ZapA